MNTVLYTIHIANTSSGLITCSNHTMLACCWMYAYTNLLECGCFCNIWISLCGERCSVEKGSLYFHICSGNYFKFSNVCDAIMFGMHIICATGWVYHHYYKHFPYVIQFALLIAVLGTIKMRIKFLGMDRFHLTLYDIFNYLSMLGF